MTEPITSTVSEIAEWVNGTVVGESSTLIKGVASLEKAGQSDISFLASPQYAKQLDSTTAGAVITSRSVSNSSVTLIQVDNPDLAFGAVLQHWAPEPAPIRREIHPQASISAKAVLGKNVAVGPFAVVDAGAVIGDGTLLYAGCYVGCGATVGENCVLYPNVSVLERVTLGNRVIVHPGAVIGSDGFGFAQEAGVYKKIPQIGTVVVGDDVEIGACTTIDRARFDKTEIGRGTKIDNLVMIAHNVVIGEDCAIVCLSGVAGSSRLGNGTVMAAQSGVAMHARIGKRVTIAARGGAVKDVPADQMVAGFPAYNFSAYKQSEAAVRRLPDLITKIRALEKRVKTLESEVQNDDTADDRSTG